MSRYGLKQEFQESDCSLRVQKREPHIQSGKDLRKPVLLLPSTDFKVLSMTYSARRSKTNKWKELILDDFKEGFMSNILVISYGE